MVICISYMHFDYNIVDYLSYKMKFIDIITAVVCLVTCVLLSLLYCACIIPIILKHYTNRKRRSVKRCLTYTTTQVF